MALSVSVIVPMHNVREYVVEAIESALRQTVPPFEVIVVDDGSTDGSADLVAGAFARDCRLLRQSQRGPSAARNRAVAEASGDLIAFLDADDIWLPGKTEAQLRLFAADPALALCYSGYEMVTADGMPDGARNDRNQPPPPDMQVADIVFRNRIVTTSVVMRRDLFEMVGGFREHLRTGEDVDLWLRVAMGNRIAGVSEPLFRRRIRPGQTAGRMDPRSGIVQALTTLHEVVDVSAPASRDLVKCGVAFHCLRKARELVESKMPFAALRNVLQAVLQGRAFLRAVRYTRAGPRARPWLAGDGVRFGGAP